MASSETEENQQLEPPSPASLLEDGSVSSTTGLWVQKKANKKQGCPSTYTPRSSDGEEEGEEHFLENSGANNVGNGKDDGDDDGDDDDTSNKSPDASPAPSPPKNKRNWREEDHSVYQRGQIAKVMRSPTKTKKGRNKRTTALISTEADTDESDDDDGKPNSTSTTTSEAVNNELGEDVDAGLREAVELSRTVETNEVLDEIEASTDPNKHDRAVQEIIELWHPKLPTIVLFFRWAQRGPASHFNSDSISLVKTLAVQCGFTPLRLIVDLKNYYIRPTTNRNNFCPLVFASALQRAKAESASSVKKRKRPSVAFTMRFLICSSRFLPKRTQ